MEEKSSEDDEIQKTGFKLLEITGVLGEKPFHTCPLTLFPWELLAGIGLYQCLFRSRMVSSPNKTKQLVLGKG